MCRKTDVHVLFRFTQYFIRFLFSFFSIALWGKNLASNSNVGNQFWVYRFQSTSFNQMLWLCELRAHLSLFIFSILSLRILVRKIIANTLFLPYYKRTLVRWGKTVVLDKFIFTMFYTVQTQTTTTTEMCNPNTLLCVRFFL